MVVFIVVVMVAIFLSSGITYSSGGWNVIAVVVLVVMVEVVGGMVQ